MSCGFFCMPNVKEYQDGSTAVMVVVTDAVHYSYGSFLWREQADFDESDYY